MFERYPSSGRKSLEGSIFQVNPLIASLDPATIQIKDGRASIGLGVQPQSVVEETHLFGSVLTIVRNPSAVLGRIGLYPEVHVSPFDPLVSSLGGEMTFDFSRWDHACVTVEDQAAGWLYSLEFCDVFGDTLHKICLTPDSDFYSFRDWVELNQAGESSRRYFGRRFAAQPDGLTELPGEIIALQAPVVRSLVDHLIALETSTRVIVGNVGVVLASELKPQAVQQNGDWIFADGTHCGLHLEVGRISEVFLHRKEADHSSWTMNACEQDGGLVCSFGPSFDDSHFWDEMLTAFASRFHATNTNP